MLQKVAGSDSLYGYINGALISTLAVTAPLSCIDKVNFQAFFTDANHNIFVRELAFFSETRYPTTPLTAGGSVYWTIPDTQRRWNSMMLP